MQYKVRLGSTKRYHLFWGGGGCVKAIPRTALLLSKKLRRTRNEKITHFWEDNRFNFLHKIRTEKPNCEKMERVNPYYWSLIGALYLQ
jgi:hypothetical protein